MPARWHTASDAPRFVAVLAAAYAPRHPEQTTLYEVVRDNLETLYAAVDDGALPFALPAFVRKELDGYLDCGLLCRGFARLRCPACNESRLVSFSCKGRGFRPSCLGRRMASTAANLVETGAATRPAAAVGLHRAVGAGALGWPTTVSCWAP